MQKKSKSIVKSGLLLTLMTFASRIMGLIREMTKASFLGTGLFADSFSVAFMILQLVPIPGLSGVHFGTESYILLVVWIVLGLIFYFRERKFFTTE